MKMKLSQTFFLLAPAAIASANSVLFRSLDSVNRTIVFTSNPGCALMPSVNVPARTEVNVTFEYGWAGNWYAHPTGGKDNAGMLGEAAFDAWQGLHFFDVSAIVNPNDVNNVKMIHPASSEENRSGCIHFPCNNAYYLPDDIQTKATLDSNLICLLGTSNVVETRDTDPVWATNFPHHLLKSWAPKND